MPRKIRASKDEETQPPLSQRPEFIIGMVFLGVVAAVIISVLIFRFIRRRKQKKTIEAPLNRDRRYRAEVDRAEVERDLASIQRSLEYAWEG